MKISEIAKSLSVALVASLLVLVGPSQVAVAAPVDVGFGVEGPNSEDLNGYTVYVYDSDFNLAASATASAEVANELTFSLEPGEYSVELYPFDSVAGTTAEHQSIAPAAYRLTITNSSEISVARNLGGSFTDLTAADGVFTLNASEADVFGRVLGPDGQPVTLTPDSGITIILESWDGSFFMPGPGAIYDFVKPDGTFALEIPVSGDYRIWINPYGFSDYASSYTASFSFEAGAAPMNLGDFQVATANMSGRVLGATDSSPISFVNVSVLDQSTGFQADGLFGFSNENGVWSLNVSTNGSYFLVAEPYDLPGLVKSEAISFSVQAGTITVEGGLDPMSLDLQLREPNVVVQVRATVSGASVPVDGVWVNINSFSANVFLGAETSLQGDAGFFLESTASDWATYVWLGSNSTFDDAFQDFDGTIISSMFRDEGGKSVVTLWLQAPNLKFKLEKGAVGSETALEYANVMVSLGNWYEFGFSDENGNVEMSIDTSEIAALNSDLSGTHSLSFTIYPPYGESDVQTFQCETGASQPLFCADIPSVTIGQEFPETHLASPYLMPPPNTFILVKGPNGESIGAGAWVSLLAEVNTNGCSGCFEFVDGAVTDKNGVAGLNVDTSSYTISFSVEVQPPWDTELDVAAASHFVSSYEDLGTAAGYALAAPNLTLIVREPGGTALSQWAYAIAEEVDPSTGGFVSWIGGSGASDDGTIKLSLPANSASISLTVFPGPLSAAATTKCTVTVDSSSVVALSGCDRGSLVNGSLTLTLTSGNVAGIVTHASNPIEGALVVATNGSATVSAVTDQAGSYGLELDFATSWTIEVFYNSDTPGVPGYLNGGTISSPNSSNDLVLN